MSAGCHRSASWGSITKGTLHSQCNDAKCGADAITLTPLSASLRIPHLWRSSKEKKGSEHNMTGLKMYGNTCWESPWGRGHSLELGFNIVHVWYANSITHTNQWEIILKFPGSSKLFSDKVWLTWVTIIDLCSIVLNMPEWVYWSILQLKLTRLLNGELHY